MPITLRFNDKLSNIGWFYAYDPLPRQSDMVRFERVHLSLPSFTSVRFDRLRSSFAKYNGKGMVCLRHWSCATLTEALVNWRVP